MMQNIAAEFQKVSFAFEQQLERQLDKLEKKISQPGKSNKISASNTDHGTAIYNSLVESGDIVEVAEGIGDSIIPNDLLEAANSIYNQKPKSSLQYLKKLTTNNLLPQVKPIMHYLKL